MTENISEITPFNSGFLKVSDLHSLYYHEYGNPDGKVVIHFHGGPGSKSKSKHAKLYDLEKFRVVLFDQRGCGMSTPAGEYKQNTTQDLIEDINKLRSHLNIDKFISNGGSWGSTLALVYAQAYPENIEAMMLQGIFLGEEKEDEWIYEGGASKFYPEKWQNYLDSLEGMSGSTNREKSYNFLFQGIDKIDNEKLLNWKLWEGYLAFLNFEPDEIDFSEKGVKEGMINSGRIMTHYLKNTMFLKPGQIFNDLDKLPNVPIYVVHGRHDLVCSVSNAYNLHKGLPQSKLHIIQVGGHGISEEPFFSRMKEIISEFCEAVVNK